MTDFIINFALYSFITVGTYFLMEPRNSPVDESFHFTVNMAAIVAEVYDGDPDCIDHFRDRLVKFNGKTSIREAMALKLLPSLEYIEKAYAFNERYQKDIDNFRKTIAHLTPETRQWLDAEYDATRMLMYQWTQLYLAQEKHRLHSIYQRRGFLVDYVSQVGEANYYSGIWPDIIPRHK